MEEHSGDRDMLHRDRELLKDRIKNLEERRPLIRAERSGEIGAKGDGNSFESSGKDRARGCDGNT